MYDNPGAHDRSKPGNPFVSQAESSANPQGVINAILAQYLGFSWPASNSWVTYLKETTHFDWRLVDLKKRRVVEHWIAWYSITVNLSKTPPVSVYAAQPSRVR